MADAKVSYRLLRTVLGSVNQNLVVSACTIRSRLKDYDKAITDLISTPAWHPLAIISGVEPVYSAGIMAEIGDISRFMDQAASAK